MSSSLAPSQKCKAHSSVTGEQCKKYAIQGGTVCRSHGGAAPHVKAAAAKRLQAMVFPALTRLGEILDDRVNVGCSLGAANSILDRAGIKSKDEIEVGASESLASIIFERRQQRLRAQNAIEVSAE